MAHVKSLANGVAQDLVVVAEGALELQNMGLMLREFKVFDNASKTPYLVTVNGASEIVDRHKMQMQDNDARFARFGSLSQDLYEKVMAMGAKETLAVTIWLEGLPDDPYDRSVSRESPGFEEHFGKWRSQRAAAIKSHRKPTELRLAAAGVDVYATSDNMPMMSATLSKGQLISLSKFKDVSIELPPVIYQASVPQSQSVKSGDPSILDIPWEGPRDLGGAVGDGQGVKIGIIDNGAIDFARTSSQLSGVSRVCAQPYAPASDEYRHMLWTASVAAGSALIGTDYEGTARKGQILAATICTEPSKDTNFLSRNAKGCVGRDGMAERRRKG